MRETVQEKWKKTQIRSNSKQPKVGTVCVDVYSRSLKGTGIMVGGCVLHKGCIKFNYRVQGLEVWGNYRRTMPPPRIEVGHSIVKLALTSVTQGGSRSDRKLESPYKLMVMVPKAPLMGNLRPHK